MLQGEGTRLLQAQAALALFFRSLATSVVPGETGDVPVPGGSVLTLQMGTRSDLAFL